MYLLLSAAQKQIQVEDSDEESTEDDDEDSSEEDDDDKEDKHSQVKRAQGITLVNTYNLLFHLLPPLFSYHVI